MSAGPEVRHCHPLLRSHKNPAFSLLLLSVKGDYFPKHPVGLSLFKPEVELLNLLINLGVTKHIIPTGPCSSCDLPYTLGKSNCGT